MLFLSPLVLLICVALIAGFVAVLALWPAYPASRTIRRIWIAALVLWAGTYFWVALGPPDRLDFWIEPDWYVPARGLALVVIPFSTSYALWKVRANHGETISATATSIAVIAVCVIAWFALSAFDKSCVHYDYFHDDGKAWCPQSWQARLFGP